MRKNNKLLQYLLFICLSAVIITGFFSASPALAAKVYAPTVSVKTGTYDKGEKLSVALTTKTKNGVIYYSVNGGKFKKYKKEITISKDTTLRAYTKNNNNISKTKVFKYNFTTKVVPTVVITEPVIEYVPNSPEDQNPNEVDFSILDNYRDKPFYKSLNDDEKAFYEVIFQCCSDYSIIVTGLEKYKMTYNDASKVFHLMIAENPQLYYVNDSFFDSTDNSSDFFANTDISSLPDDYVCTFYLKTFSPIYTDKRAEVKEITPKLQKAAEKIIKEGKELYPDDTFELVRYYHDIITEMTTYDATGFEDRITAGTNDILVDGKGLCTAYARAFSYLCQLSGIPCVNIEGTGTNISGDTEGHCWNKVCIDNAWYSVDTCWDDQNFKMYMYFCLTDNTINFNHTAHDYFIIDSMKSTSSNNTYFNHYNYKENMNSYDTQRELFSTLTDSILSAEELKSGDYIYSLVHYCPSNAIRTYLNNELSNNMWSTLKATSSEAYYKLVTKGAYGYYMTGYDSALIAILIK